MRPIHAMLLLLPFLWGCTAKTRVPEITPSIVARPIYRADEPSRPTHLMAQGSRLLFITADDSIGNYNLESGQVDSVYHLTTPIVGPEVRNGPWLLLKHRQSPSWTLFNLDTLQVEKVIAGPAACRAWAVDHRFLVYSEAGELVCIDHRNNTPLARFSLEGEEVLSASIHLDRTLVLTRRALVSVDHSGAALNRWKLDHEAISGHHFWDDAVYYGSEDRSLVKFSTRRPRTVWRFRLAMPLTLTPQRAGAYIVVTPQDNNIYFLKPNGTLHWWEKFDSTRHLPALVMEQNVAVFLMNQTVKFFNHQTRKSTEFRLKAPLTGRPVYLNRYVYALERKEKKAIAIIKLGNLFGIHIKMDPPAVKPAGKSIAFELSPINLLQPRIRVTIEDARREAVFSTTFSPKNLPHFVWVPREAGQYMLRLQAASKNMDEVTVEKSFQVVDLVRLIHGYTHQVMQKCRFGRIR